MPQAVGSHRGQVLSTQPADSSSLGAGVPDSDWLPRLSTELPLTILAGPQSAPLLFPKKSTLCSLPEISTAWLSSAWPLALAADVKLPAPV